MRSSVLTGPAVMLAFAVAVIGLARGADAPAPNLPPGVTCEDVRANVAIHGRVKARLWARAKGYTKVEISEAEKCLR